MPQQFKNNWSYTLTSGIDNVQTTINVGASGASLISDASATNWYYLTIDDNANIEIVKVTSANGTTGDLTVVRGQDGTSAASFASGTLIESRVTEGSLEALQNMPDTSADRSVMVSDGTDTKLLTGTGVSISTNDQLSGHGAAISAQTASYTLAASDNGKVVTINSASAVTLTLPDQATTTLPAGFQVAVIQRGAGQVTVAASGSDTIESVGGNSKLAGQHSAATIVLLVAGSPNTWGLYGDISA